MQTYLCQPGQPTCPNPAQQDSSNGDPQHPSFSPEVFVTLASQLKREPFKLLHAEILQIFNIVPRNRMELVMIVEEGEDRYNDEVLEQMLQLIEDVLVRKNTISVVPLKKKSQKARMSNKKR